MIDWTTIVNNLVQLVAGGIGTLVLAKLRKQSGDLNAAFCKIRTLQDQLAPTVGAVDNVSHEDKPMNNVELWLLGKILDEATSTSSKQWVLAELKQLDSSTTKPALKVVVEALEKFLAQSAAA